MPVPKGKKSVKKKPAKKPGKGRPSKYKAEYAEQSRKLCLLGYTDQKLADFFGVQVTTIDNWKKGHREFLGAVNAGKEIADAEVADAFHKRAVGYRYEEVTYERLDIALDGEKDDSDIKMEQYKKKVVTKELPPDPGAALNWLKNRQKDKWRDKVEHGVTDKDGNDVRPILNFGLTPGCAPMSEEMPDDPTS